MKKVIGTMIGVFLFCGCAGLKKVPQITEHYYLPQELQKIAGELKCEEVPGFYKRPGMVDPPYVYGYLPGEKEKSAAFWCYQAGTEKPYLLVFLKNRKLSDYIRWHNFPGGLSLSFQSRLPLSEFRYIDNPAQSGPDEAVTEYQPLQEEYDGVSTYFYSHEGRWLYRMLD